MKKYINTREVCSVLGVHPNTLRKWEKEGKILAIRTPGNKRLYNLDSLLKKEKIKIIYARVSSNGQKQDLENQIKYLRSRYPDYELIQDIGSGLNFKRKGFKSLLEQVLLGEISEIVIAHRDRLCRFGFELIEFICDKFGTKIVVLDESSLSPQAELVRDIISIIHVFSSRIHGLRKYSSKIKEDKDLSKKE